MADKSHIQWTEATWNPLVGCTAVSPGCDHCYAARETSGRLSHLPLYAGLAKGGVFTGEVRLAQDRLDQPLKWRRPRRIFVNSMSDLLHDGVPDQYVAAVFAVMIAAPHHTFQVLTKRHGRLRSLLTNDGFWLTVSDELGKLWGHTPAPLSAVPPWIWIGVSVENQQWANIRIPALLATPAAVRWLSCEPLLGPVDLDAWMCSCGGRRWVDDENWSPAQGVLWRGERSAGDGRIPCGLCNHGGWDQPDGDRPRIDWVVTGGESGPGARPAHPDWFRDIRDRCSISGTAYFHKQNGEWLPLGPLYEQDDGTDEDVSEDARHEAVHLEVVERREVIELERSGYIVRGHQPGDNRTWLMARVGKKAAGRELDGRTWDEYPRAVPHAS